MSHYAKSLLQAIPAQGEVLFADDDRITSYQGDVVVPGEADAVIRARDIQEISEVLAYCHQHKIPVTFLGGQTGLTGAASSQGGVSIATGSLDQVIDIGTRKDGQAYAVVQPGIFLGELKQHVGEHKFFYPPDPTSYREARLGGTIATNATGEDSLMYGPTRAYIRALKTIRADGKILNLERPLDDQPPLTKGTAGFVRSDPEIDLLIGSEGTLGFIAEATLDLLQDPAEWWAGMAFFEQWETALDFIRQALQQTDYKPRALELLDRNSLEFMRGADNIQPIPEDVAAAVYWKQEYRSPQEQEASLSHWYDLLLNVKNSGHEKLHDEAIWIAQTDKELDQFRRWRHYIPAKINEIVAENRKTGGGKSASDWWVPTDKIREALALAIKESKAAGIDPIIFGHIGNGHPHINYLSKTAETKQAAAQLIKQQCQRAVDWGGGVAGEHGLGKIHRDLLPLQRTPEQIKRMLAIKQQWDPHWILGRGTLFDVPDWV